MLKIIVFNLLACVIASSLYAQSYEQQVQIDLAAEYGLPTGIVITNPDEAQVLAEAFTYGVTREDFTVQGQLFSNALRMTTPAQVREPFDHAAIIRNEQSISAGDRLLFVCYVRGENPAGTQSILQLWAEENGGVYEKYGGGIVYANDEWQRILLPFEAPEDLSLIHISEPTRPY